jgi:thiamine-monophosphate kinase
VTPGGPDPDPTRGDDGEFGWIERLLRPLTRGHPGALDLLDDAAVITPREGHDLVITKDAMVAGVHFLADDPLDTVARKLLAVNLSDLAAKGADPVGYFLSVAWPRDLSWEAKRTFADGLRLAGETWALPLLGGDTVSTPGPLTLSATLIGDVPTGGMVRRATARPGDLVMVSGCIGDGWLGLKAARGELVDPEGYLARRYRTPTPRLDLIPTLRRFASASADVSDGLLADAGRIAIASGCAIEIALEQLPVSVDAGNWLAGQPGHVDALLALASGGDDYQIVFTVSPEAYQAMDLTGDLVSIGQVTAGQGVTASFEGRSVPVERLGWTHG